MNSSFIDIHTEYIRLDQLLKLAGVCTCGSDAKQLIIDGRVFVNNQPIIQRGKKLRGGDFVRVALEDNIQFTVRQSGT